MTIALTSFQDTETLPDVEPIFLYSVGAPENLLIPQDPTGVSAFVTLSAEVLGFFLTSQFPYARLQQPAQMWCPCSLTV